MCPLKRFWFYFLLLFYFYGTGQQPAVPTKSDTVYQKINTYAKDKKVVKFFHKLIFRRNVFTSTKTKKKTKSQIAIQREYAKHQCKVIRNITIETLDPFGYAAEDATKEPKYRIERWGNFLHIKTKNWTVRNFLLFKKHDLLDSLNLRESERLLRQQRYIRTVIIKPVAIPNSKDSVDVSIRVLDTWSAIPTGAISTSKGNIDFTERNFLGLGHEFDFDYLSSFDSNTANTFGYDTHYTIPNFKNSFITTTVSARNDLNNATQNALRIERKFYSTYAHWAGGIYHNYSAYTEKLNDTATVPTLLNFKSKSYQLWGAHSFSLFGNGNEFSRGTHLIAALGLNHLSYLNQPELQYDPIRFVSSSKSVLATIGISSQRFYQEKYLFRYGVVEDVPYGKVFSITGGLENKNHVNRAYWGSRFSYGDLFEFGYLQGNFEFGTFLNNGKSEQTTYKLEANYFTNLIPLGNWQMRQFIRPVLVLGGNRLNSERDRLKLVDINGIPGFDTRQLTGTKKFLTTLQTQWYCLKDWYGFNLSPYFNFTFGFLDQGNHVFFNNKMYSQLGIGILINNKYLVFSSFQFSFSYYPTLPLSGNNIIKTNTFQNNSIDFNDFQIGQPYVLPFQ